MKLKGKVVLLVGASSGIGKALAKTLIDMGAKVIVFGIHKPEFYSEFYKVDITKEKEIISEINKIKKIDILINNAGIVKITTIEDSTLKMVDEVFNVNFKGALLVSKYSIPKLSEGGCIVNISSIAGITSYANYGIYCASKSALISLTKTLAIELADRKIRVNAIAPGVIDTPIWNKMYGKEGRKMLEEEVETIPLKKYGKPEDISHAVVFACENDFLNGETIVVDGGETIS